MDGIILVIGALLALGILFNFLGSLGLLRFPDVYTRLHAATKATTFGSIAMTAAVFIYGLMNWWDDKTRGSELTLSLHALFALAVLLFTNPNGAHAIARATYKSGTKPWFRPGSEVPDTDQLAVSLDKKGSQEPGEEKPEESTEEESPFAPKVEAVAVASETPAENEMEMNPKFCVYCGSPENIHEAHLIAPSKGGKMPVPACSKCNQSKGNKALMEWFRWVKENREERWEQIVTFNKSKRHDIAQKIHKIRDEPAKTPKGGETSA